MENRARMSYKPKLSQTKFRCETTEKLKKMAIKSSRKYCLPRYNTTNYDSTKLN